MSQPALSQQVRLLERDLQVDLFVRTSRVVQLTPAGQALLDAAPHALAEIDRAVDATRQAARGVTGRLTVGSVRTGLGGVLPAIMRDSPKPTHPCDSSCCSWTPRCSCARWSTAGSTSESCGAAAPVHSLQFEPLTSEALMVAVLADHPLAAQDTVDPAHLAAEPFVGWPRHLGPEFFDVVIAFCREHGFSPDINTEGSDIDTQLALVAAGFGVSLQPAYYVSARPDGVVFRALSGEPPQVSLQLAWRRDGPPVVEQFVAAARRLIDDTDDEDRT